MRGKAKKIITDSAGLSLLEAVLYVAFLGGIAVFTANFLIQIVNVYNAARIEREVLSNARLILGAVAQEAGEARELYPPTSRFNTTLGQLSFASATSTYPEHTSAYTDFYVDNGAFMTRREGAGTQRLSAPSVRITAFTIERIVAGLDREAVRMTLGVAAASPRYAASTTLHTSITLRGGY